MSELISAGLLEAGRNQLELAEFVGVTQPTVSRWIHGAYPPGREYWAKIESFLRLAPNTIAHAAGHVIVTEDGAEALPPLVVKAARDLAELAPADRKMVMQLIGRLLDQGEGS